MRPTSGIRVGDAGRKGRGVFATKHFLPGDMIERAPLLVIPEGPDIQSLTGTVIEHYWYETNDGGTALGLGYSSLYNHSTRANAIYDACREEQTIYIVAVREIKVGTEITINYNGDPNCRDKLSFSNRPKEAIPAETSKGDVHYLDQSDWGQDGWVWCGECEVRWTTSPNMVTCQRCQFRMLAEQNKLSTWSPSSGGPTKKELLRLMAHTAERLSLEGLAGYADVVTEAIKVIENRIT